MAAVHRLVIVRHGESVWNQENRFCGWFDADLSEKGMEEAERGALAIKEAGLKFDVCYTSVLKRAVKTLWTIMEGTDQMWLPVIRTWRLNERHYGGLTGLNKAETAAKHGEEQVKIWRRSFDTPPPPMDNDHAYHKIISEVSERKIKFLICQNRARMKYETKQGLCRIHFEKHWQKYLLCIFPVKDYITV